MEKFNANQNERLSEENGRIIINTADRLGESNYEKGCYWSVYTKFGKYYITLQDENNNVWEVSKEDAVLYNEIPCNKITQQQQILKELVKLSGLKQKDFAKEHGVEVTKLSRWITGKQNVRPETVELIAFECGYTIETNFKLIRL